MPYELPPLPYAEDALEPHIDVETMRIHHGKHHKAYVDKLNAALDGSEWEGEPIEDLLRNLDRIGPESTRSAVRNQGGGHYNHSLFWTSMAPQGGGEPTGELAEAIAATFGSFAGFQDRFKQAALGQFGSGWCWLAQGGSGLEIVATANQDNPLSQGLTPLLGVDVWEHAYYLRYQNRRPDYLDAWWNVVDWRCVGERLLSD